MISYMNSQFHMWEYELIYEFIHKNFLMGHFLVQPKSYVFFMKSYMNSWFFMNSCMNFDMKSLPGHFLVHQLARFHEIMPDIMDLGLFSWERSYVKSCLKNIVKNIVKNTLKGWKICMNSSSNSWARCADAQYLMGAGHSAAAAPEHLPHCQHVYLAELKCQYLTPWSCHTLSSCCQRA